MGKWKELAATLKERDKRQIEDINRGLVGMTIENRIALADARAVDALAALTQVLEYLDDIDPSRQRVRELLPEKNMSTNKLIDEWAEAAGVRFVNRSNGEYTTSTVSRYDFQQLITAAVARERKACAKAIEAEHVGVDVCDVCAWQQ